MFILFHKLFEAQELGSIGVTVTITTYYGYWQQLLPSYMTLLVRSFSGMCATTIYR